MLKKFALLACLLSLSACQSYSVHTHNDPNITFDQYRRFAWMESEPFDPNQAPQRALAEKQLRFIVERELSTKGRLKDGSQPDFLISYYGDREEKRSTVVYDDAWGTRGRYGRYGHGGYTRSYQVHTYDYSEGTLHVDFVDTKTDQVVWQAIITGFIDKSDPIGPLESALTKALKDFPPKNPSPASGY